MARRLFVSVYFRSRRRVLPGKRSRRFAVSNQVKAREHIRPSLVAGRRVPLPTGVPVH